MPYRVLKYLRYLCRIGILDKSDLTHLIKKDFWETNDYPNPAGSVY